MEQSILKALYRSMSNKRSKICEDYGVLLVECGGGVVQLVVPKESVSVPTKISKKVLPVTPKVVKVLKTPTKKNFTQTSSPVSGGNRDVVSDRTTSLMWQKKTRWYNKKMGRLKTVLSDFIALRFF